jgi:tRNA A22 N-methylase
MKPLGYEHNRKVREHLAEQGIEMTPDELVAERKAAYETIRREMRAKGYTMPDSDEEIFLLLKEMGAK